MTGIAELIGRSRLLPVAVIEDADRAVPLARALAAGGVSALEIALRTPSAVDALARAAVRAARALAVGAGTVLTAHDVDRVVEAGARFVVSPGFDVAVVRRCRELAVPVLPGVATATEVQRALAAGVGTVKLFPAQPLGLPYLAALASAFPGVRFVPTGGMDLALLPTYLRHPSVLAVAGSWMLAPAAGPAPDFGAVTRLTARAVALSTAAEPR